MGTAELSFLYDLKEEVALNLTVDQITSTIIFGSMGISGLYDPTHTYKRGDVVPYIDENGIVHVYECTMDGATGSPIDMRYWQEFSVLAKLKELRNDLIVLSANQPVNTATNKLWFIAKSTSSGSIDLGDNTGLIVVNNFVISTNEPTPFTPDLVWGKVTEILPEDEEEATE